MIAAAWVRRIGWAVTKRQPGFFSIRGQVQVVSGLAAVRCYVDTHG